MTARDFRDLLVWQTAVAPARASYLFARRLPRVERSGLALQIRRAAASVPANIAEGHTSPHRREFVRYLGIAHGSLKELESHVLVAAEVGHVHRESITDPLAPADETSRMLRVMRQALGEPPPRVRVQREALRPRSALRAPDAPRRGPGDPPQHTDRRNRSQS